MRTAARRRVWYATQAEVEALSNLPDGTPLGAKDTGLTFVYDANRGLIPDMPIGSPGDAVIFDADARPVGRLIAGPPTIDGTTSSNTTDPKDILSYVIPAGALGPNGIIRFATHVVVQQTTGSDQTLTVAVQLSSTSSFSTNPETPAIPSGTPNLEMRVDGVIQNQNDATAQEGRIEIELVRASGAGSSTVYKRLVYFSGAIDTDDSGDVTLGVALHMNVADANFIFATRFGTAESFYIP